MPAGADGGPTTRPWPLAVRRASSLPPLAWLARVSAEGVDVVCGTSVRHEGRVVFEGTWAGPAGLDALPEATTVYGSGLVVDAEGLLVVPPSHTVEGVWAARHADTLIVANSFVAVLVAAGLRLDPAAQYPLHFRQVGQIKWPALEPKTGSLRNHTAEIPTLDGPLHGHFWENLRIGRDLSLTVVRKPREAPFESYDDYHGRLIAAAAQLLSNGRPYEPIVALSAGYDSTAVAAVAAGLGCDRALSLATARSFATKEIVVDEGTEAAAALGMKVELFDRLAYRSRTDLPEADFLATGTSGEDVVMSAFEPRLHRALLLTGFWAGHIWSSSPVYPPPGVPAGDYSGGSLGEHRLRADYLHVPLPFFGALGHFGIAPFVDQPDMRPYFVGGHYDRPIPRRIAEEAGVRRGTFALAKRGAASMLQRSGRAGFAPATAADIDRFAAAEGGRVSFTVMPGVGRPTRALIKLTRKVPLDWLARRLELRRLSRAHFEPRLGNLLLRWAVSVVA
ncbi:MAG TPA: hypothetical protein VEX62_05135, partial [Candidatus Limnocylindrales bacterium]|nr:hypothetical protein [Candidatus Limnocylindrales bacterium]